MIRAVRILPSCIGCGVCEFLCPDVFRNGRRARVVGGPEDFAAWEPSLPGIADLCPVLAIEVDRVRSRFRARRPRARASRTRRS